MPLPTDPKERKGLPIVTGVWDYFPDCWGEIAKASLAGNKQHLEGQPLQWDRSKSKDDVDAAGRHLLERGARDTDGVLHTAKAAWRILAVLQKEIEEERGKGQAEAADFASQQKALSRLDDSCLCNGRGCARCCGPS